MAVELGIQIDERFHGVVDERRLGQVVKHVLAAEGIAQPVELGLVITNDEVMRDLNKRYRNIDATTDVLSFTLLEEQPEHGGCSPFVVPPDGVLHLGEVIISYPRALRQAEEYQHTIEEEIEQLIAHGVLHLLGHGHEEPEFEQETGQAG